MIDVVVAAGGEVPRSFHGRAAGGHLALVELEQRSCLERVVEGLRGCRRVDRIWVVAPAQVQRRLNRLEVEWLPAQPLAYQNYLRGLEAVRTSHALMTVCDLPFANGPGLDDFLDRCRLELDFNYGLATRTEMLEKFPGYQRNYVKVKEGFLTGSCLGLVRPGAVLERRHDFAEVFENRKSSMKVALRMGLPFLWGHFHGRMPLAQVERRFERVFGMSCATIPSTCPGWTLDLDSFEDYDYARWWNARGGSSRKNR